MLTQYTRTCPQCNQPFTTRRKSQQLCSVRCTSDSRRIQDSPERFWSLVDRSGGPEACWPWRGTRGNLGYGRYHLSRPIRTSVSAHRKAWELTHGPIPEGKLACHRCDNPPCCNPAHIFIGTHDENMADAARKDRMSHAPRPGSGRKPGLTPDQVRDIRRRYAAGKANIVQLGREYGKHKVTISEIIRRLIYKHVE